MGQPSLPLWCLGEAVGTLSPSPGAGAVFTIQVDFPGPGCREGPVLAFAMSEQNGARGFYQEEGLDQPERKN